MAKKPKKAEEPEEAAPPEDGQEVKPGRLRKLAIFGGIGLAALSALGAGGYWFFANGRGETGEAPKNAAPVVNLANEPNQDRPKVLKFRAALEVKDKKLVAEIQPLLPRVEDSFQVFVRELRASDLDGSAGVYRLREELLRRVNVAVYPAKVDAVLFKDIILQ